MDESLTADRVRSLCFPEENGDCWEGRLELQFRLAPGFTWFHLASLHFGYSCLQSQTLLAGADIC